MGCELVFLSFWLCSLKDQRWFEWVVWFGDPGWGFLIWPFCLQDVVWMVWHCWLTLVLSSFETCRIIILHIPHFGRYLPWRSSNTGRNVEKSRRRQASTTKPSSLTCPYGACMNCMLRDVREGKECEKNKEERGVTEKGSISLPYISNGANCFHQVVPFWCAVQHGRGFISIMSNNIVWRLLAFLCSKTFWLGCD